MLKEMREKVRYVTLALSLQSVTRLKFEILSFLEPRRRFEATLAYLFVHSYIEPFRMWLLKNRVKSKQNAQEALTTVDQLEHRIQNKLFDKK
jgi:hypothetical protein